MDSICLIVKITDYSYSGYDYYPEEDVWSYRGSHSGDGHEEKFHSAHTTMQEAMEILNDLWYEVLERHADPDDESSPICYTEYSGYLIRELHLGDEISRIRY